MKRFALSFAAAVPVALFALTGCPSSSDPAPETPISNDPALLTAPAQGKGFQFKTDLFSVAPGDEVQDCYFYKISELAKAGGLDPTKPVNLNRVQMVQKDGSHHMNLFRVKTIVKDAAGVVQLGPELGPIQRAKNGTGACFKSPNWADWPLVANTQQDGAVDWKFPEGVANVFQPDEWIMLQTHYVNAGSQKTPENAQVAVNWHTIPAEEVKQEMGTLFATQQSIRVCKNNPTPEFIRSAQFKNTNSPITIIGANGHFHGRGKKFDMYAVDGRATAKPANATPFYTSERWDDPPMARSPELQLKVAPGGSVLFTCSYQWVPPSDAAGGCAALDAIDKSETKDCCYTFGPIVEKNEHCNAFVYYYPKSDTDIFTP
jgi:hypothetical protein